MTDFWVLTPCKIMDNTDISDEHFAPFSGWWNYVPVYLDTILSPWTCGRHILPKHRYQSVIIWSHMVSSDQYWSWKPGKLLYQHTQLRPVVDLTQNGVIKEQNINTGLACTHISTNCCNTCMCACSFIDPTAGEGWMQQVRISLANANCVQRSTTYQMVKVPH